MMTTTIKPSTIKFIVIAAPRVDLNYDPKPTTGHRKISFTSSFLCLKQNQERKKQLNLDGLWKTNFYKIEHHFKAVVRLHFIVFIAKTPRNGRMSSFFFDELTNRTNNKFFTI